MKLSNVKTMLLSIGAGAAILGFAFTSVQTFGSSKQPTGFVMGTGNQNVKIVNNQDLDKKIYMSVDDEIGVRSEASQENCDRTCQLEIYEMVQEYASELEGVTVVITDDTKYGLIQKEEDVLYVNFNVTEDFIGEFLINQ